MRLLAITFLMLSLAGMAAADKKALASSAESVCSGTGHLHQYSDIRIAAVEVMNVEECGFSYVDLEENTVGLDNHFFFDIGLEIIQVEKKAANSGLYQTAGATRGSIKRGLRAIAVYCQGCKAVINLKPLSDSEIAIRGWNK
jgi:hypothetical protein